MKAAKGIVFTVLDGNEKTYFRQIIEGPRFVLLITQEDGLVIEAEVWDRMGHQSIFYEIDVDAMERYSEFHPESD